MGAARKLRSQVVYEDADEPTVLEVRYLDPVEVAVAPEDTWPEWWCDDCGTRNDGWRIPCGYCGVVRPDVDQCE